MPIYEYRCQDCHHEFERMQKFSDPPADSCPSCTGTVQKLISRSAFHLKGDGWYVTDYARKSGSNGSNGSSDSKSSSSDSGSSTDSASKSSASSESKASSEGSASTSKASSNSSAATASSTAS